MTHDAVIKVTGVRFKDYCEGLIASTFDVNAIKVRASVHFWFLKKGLCSCNSCHLLSVAEAVAISVKIWTSLQSLADLDKILGAPTVQHLRCRCAKTIQ